MNVKITGSGYFLPDKIETSLELSKKINKSEEWILSRTGVLERRISDIDVDKMGAIAGRKALNGEKPDFKNIDIIIPGKDSYPKKDHILIKTQNKKIYARSKNQDKFVK